MESDNQKRMLEFINTVIGEVGEWSIFDDDRAQSNQYFLRGGCFVLYKVVKHYFPSVNLMMKRDYKHCVILYDGVCYDANGIVEDVEDYIPATSEDFILNEENFGRKIKQLEAPNIIKVMQSVNLKDILY
jgi:hypothetical protein